LRARKVAPRVASVALVVTGVVLVGYVLLGQSLPGQTQESAPAGGGAKGLGIPEVGANGEVPRPGPAVGPKDKTLELTIPEMARLRHDAVPDAPAGDEAALRKSAAIHLKGTGFPWQRGTNVYLAGHRLGYPGTESWLTFWDLNKLSKADVIYVTDADGTKYVYKVFEKFVVGPGASWVTKPVAGKSVLTLQTCTLPDYDQRLIVRGELVGEVPGKAEKDKRASVRERKR
jgi:sortase A